jgi:histidyl-tRNA synthetase
MSDSMRCRGMRDVLPQEMARYRRVEQIFRDVCTGWGYQEVRTPTVEHLHLFTSAGTLSPQMLGRVYSFLDWDGWSGERVVLRPDTTIPVARMYVEQGHEGTVQKFFYVQNVLRFAEGEESRENWQCGIELIGDTQPIGDVELVLIADEVLRGLGLEGSVKLSDPGIMRAVLTKAGYDGPEQLRAYDRLLEGELQVLDELAERIPAVGGMLRALLAGEGEGLAYIENMRAGLLSAIPELERPLSERCDFRHP